MNSSVQILTLLSDGKFHSGEDLGRQLAISRSAVWKKIKSLDQYGLLVYSIKGKGYRLSKPIEFLDREEILCSVDTDIKPFLNSLTIHQEIDSTNQFLLDRIDKPDFHRHIVLTEFQSAGRGRRGRSWVSPYASGITMSAGWHFETPPERLTSISLGAAVAVMRVLKRIGIENAGLKWPNDIICQSRKLGGLLVELKAESTGPCNVVIGTGINYSFPLHKMDSIDQPWVDITTIQQKPVSRNLLCALLISELFRVLLQIRNGDFGNIIAEWRKYDVMKDKQVTLLLPDNEIHGQVLGIDNTGALLISVDGITRTFNSGEISLRAQH